MSNPIISIRAPTRGATGYYICKWLDGDISIRAPTRGATPVTGVTLHCVGISIRAPTRGATEVFPYVLRKYQFQSALPRGERRKRIARESRMADHFNPRSHEGSDIFGSRFFDLESRFQSALPRGERQIRLAKMKTYGRFQSALPRGERPG